MIICQELPISVHCLRSQISQEPAQHLQGEADDPARLEGFHRGDCLDDQEFHLCDDYQDHDVGK